MLEIIGKDARVLITGGAGFIGSNLACRLLEQDVAVICVDNLSTGGADNIKSLSRFPRFQFIYQDVCDPLSFEVDAIFNLACPASPNYYQQAPIDTTRACVLGALNILDLALRLNCPILQASTSEVYGDPVISPQGETYWGNVNPIGPRACYDEGKRCAEALFFDYFRIYGVPVRVARIFNTYGPRLQASDGRVISNFIVQALSGAALTVYGDGNQTRSFCYIDDMIDGLIRLIGSAIIGPVNLGNPREITVLELAESVIRLCNSKSIIKFLPALPDDPARRNPDISLAKQQLGWAPQVSLDEGLTKTIAFFRGGMVKQLA